MKIVIIRHAEPDYPHNCLTEKGLREAELLADRLVKEPADAYYTSSMGRAMLTAHPTLTRLGKTAKVYDWMREFSIPIRWEDGRTQGYPWDQYPAYWKADEAYFDRKKWHTTNLMRSGDLEAAYGRVTNALDELIASHGYVRDGEHYRAERPNTDTIVLFCHFGVECVFLGHLLGISPVVLWHGTCSAPTGVTTVVTEEREEGIASFRMQTFGDVSHLTMAGEEPSFSARFCEMYTDFSQRH